MISMYEVIGENKKFIYQTQLTGKTYKEENKELYYFNTVEINTDVFENNILTTKKIEFEIIRVKHEKNKTKTTKIIGKRRLRLKNILELREGKAFNIDILDSNSKRIGFLSFHR